MTVNTSSGNKGKSINSRTLSDVGGKYTVVEDAAGSKTTRDGGTVVLKERETQEVDPGTSHLHKVDSSPGVSNTWIHDAKSKQTYAAVTDQTTTYAGAAGTTRFDTSEVLESRWWTHVVTSTVGPSSSSMTVDRYDGFGKKVTENGWKYPDGSVAHDNHPFGAITQEWDWHTADGSSTANGITTPINDWGGTPWWHTTSWNWSGQVLGWMQWAEQTWNEYKEDAYDLIQAGLTLASIIAPPGLSAVFGLINVGIDYARGKPVDWTDVALAALPGVGALGRVGKVAGGLFNYCKAGERAALAIGHGVQAGVNIYQGAQALGRSAEEFRQGNYGAAAGELAMGVLGVAGGARAGLKGMKALDGRYDPPTGRKLKPGESSTRGCFAAGTPLRTPFGALAIEDLRPGDQVLARCERDANAPVVPRIIEKVFQSLETLWDIEVNGRTIRTTGNHPFYVARRGWVPASELTPGDRVAGELEGVWYAVESARAGDTLEAVYNLRVAEDHTYFVGAPDWGFAVWVHNDYAGTNERGSRYEKKVSRQYGGSQTLKQREYITMNNQRRVADRVATIDGKKIAVEAKHTTNWSESIYNPDSPIGKEPFAVDRQRKIVGQARDYLENFDRLIFHSNSKRLLKKYGELFSKSGLDMNRITFIFTR